MELAKYFISRAEGNGFPNSSRLKAVNGHCLSIDGKDWFCCPAEWIRNLIEGWISQYIPPLGSERIQELPSFGGVRTFCSSSVPVDREGLTVLNSILPVNEHRIIFQSGLTYSHKDEMDPIQTIKTHFFKVMSAQYLLIP